MRKVWNIVKTVIILLVAFVIVFSVGSLCKSCSNKAGITLPSWFPSWGLFDWFKKNGGTKPSTGTPDPEKPSDGGEIVIPSYVVKFISTNADPITVTVQENKAIGDKMPADPLRDTAITSRGCPQNFLGWFENDTIVTRDTVVISDITAHAKWRMTPHDYFVVGEEHDENGHSLYRYRCTVCSHDYSAIKHSFVLDKNNEQTTDEHGHECKNYRCEFCDKTTCTVIHIYDTDGICTLCGEKQKQQCEHELHGNYCIKCGEFISDIKETSNNDGDNTGGSGDNTGGNGDNTGGSGDNTGGNGDNTGGSGDNTGGNGDNTGGSGDNTGGNGDNTGGNGDNTGGSGDNTGGNGDGNTDIGGGVVESNYCPPSCDCDCIYGIDCCDCPECAERMCCGVLPSSRIDTVASDLGLNCGKKGFKVIVKFDSEHIASYFDITFSYTSPDTVIIEVETLSDKYRLFDFTSYVNGGVVLSSSWSGDSYAKRRYTAKISPVVFAKPDGYVVFHAVVEKV